VNDAAIPPPREYPIIENPPDAAPVQERFEEVIAKRISVA